MNVTLDLVKQHAKVQSFIKKSNQHLGNLGFTEHSFRHVTLVSQLAKEIMEQLGYSKEEQELAAIAGYLHDVGNVVARWNHAQSGALIAFNILDDLGMPPDQLATVIAAIGNHDEHEGMPVNPVGAALILADKSDVHRSRVRNQDFATFDIHDRVNYAVEQSSLVVNPEKLTVTMELTIDIGICPVMEYFEIFLTRMVMCRRAADFLNCKFALVINGAKLL